MLGDSTTNMIFGLALGVIIVVLAVVGQFIKRRELDRVFLIVVLVCFLLLVVHIIRLYAGLPGVGF